MEYKQGKSIFGGVAIGKISIYGKKEFAIKRERVEDTKKELTRFEQAKEQAVTELRVLYEKAVLEVGKVNAELFEVHAMMLEDEDYNDSVKNIICSQKVNAEYAVARTGDNFFKMFDEMEDEYFKARSADIKDITERLLGALTGQKREFVNDGQPCIVLAKELTPSETIQMDKNKILAFVTEIGSQNSHTAILARSMNIPALIGIEVQSEWDGKIGAVDGFSGKFYVEPDEETLKKLRQLEDEQKKKQELLQELKGKESITKDGRTIHLYANIGHKSDMASVLENDAEGIGLFRTEFLYLEREDYPSEQEQFQVYKYVAETLAGKKLIIRTLDIGADKKADYFQLEQEENPAMGYRAIRICMKQKDIFKTQLRAILRAAVYGNISVMFPMIISVNEVQKAKEILRQAEAELQSEGLKYGKLEIGIMIETPASVMISSELAEEVDFFSIGTNDLTQYTLAIDRQNPQLDEFYDAHHLAVLRMIEMVVKNAHQKGVWVGICGELAADTTLTKTFLDMGVDELSVSVSMILEVRKAVRE